MSIKDAEWPNRESSSRTLHLGTRSSNKFLCIPVNKTAVIRFLMEQWKSPWQRQKHMENVLCYLWVAVLPDYQRTVRRGLRAISNRVEIITRRGWHSPILLMQLNLAVCLLLSLLKKQMSWFCALRCSTKSLDVCTRHVEERPGSLTWSSSAMHGGSVCNALIGTFGMHAFTGCTGCDTITAFAGQGRRQPQPLECLTSDKAYKELKRLHWTKTFIRSIWRALWKKNCKNSPTLQALKSTSTLWEPSLQATIGQRCFEPSPFVPGSMNWLRNITEMLL